MLHFSGVEDQWDAECRDLAQLRPRLRYKVSRALGFACPDIEDVVQETFKRYLESVHQDRVRTPEASGAFLNGICRNVISEYRRRLFRDGPMPEYVPEPTSKGISPPELFELREAVAEGMRHLSARDRSILQMFYLDEAAVALILEATGLTEANFRVVLCRAKERFRQIYLDSCNKVKVSATS